MNSEYYAHSLAGEPPQKWQPLADHLRNVAEPARKFADLCCIASAKLKPPFGVGLGLEMMKGELILKNIDDGCAFQMKGCGNR